MKPLTDLDVHIVHDAVLVPPRGHKDWGNGVGVLRRTADGYEPVTRATLRRKGRQYLPEPTGLDIEPTRSIGWAVFGGYLYRHFGHFLLEGLARAWYDEIRSRTPRIYIGMTAAHVAPYMDAAFEMLDMRGRPRIVHSQRGPVHVRHLVIPDPGFEIATSFHPLLAERLGVVPAAPRRDSTKVWLSRTALPDDEGGLMGEAVLEEQLATRGWTIVHPETLPLREQVEMLAGASHIAGVEGSAFHTLMFVKGFRGTVDIIERHGRRNYDVIANRLGLDQARYPAAGASSTVFKRNEKQLDTRWEGMDVAATVDAIERSIRRQG